MFLHTYLPNPILFNFGFYQIRWYGLILALAMAGGFFVIYKLYTSPSPSPPKGEGVGSSLSPYEGKRRREVFFNLLFWIAVGGIVGGRLVHVLTFFNYYWRHPLEIFFLWHGGIAFYGVFIGGLVMAWFLIRHVILSEARIRQLAERAKSKDPLDFSHETDEGIPRQARNDKNKKNRLISILNSFFLLLDSLVIGLAFGQFIGRWGNWFNQELFGRPTDLPWGIPIAFINRPAGFENFQYFHPVFLYESLFSLVLFFVLWGLYKKIYLPQPPPYKGGEPTPALPLAQGEVWRGLTMKQFHQWNNGIVFAVFLLGHSAARFFLEFLRLDAQPEFLGLRLFQWVALAEFLAGWLVYFYIRIWYNKNKTS
jgi:phosphatidylglycerol:prolipoprotein diacylglycerol transferase